MKLFFDIGNFRFIFLVSIMIHLKFNKNFCVLHGDLFFQLMIIFL